jgi:VWFA-related protein
MATIAITRRFFAVSPQAFLRFFRLPKLAPADPRRRTSTFRLSQTLLAAAFGLATALASAQQQLPDAPQPQNNAPLPPPPAEALPASTASESPAPAIAPSTAPAPNPLLPATSAGTGKPSLPPSLPAKEHDELFTFVKHVNFVLLPVTVKNPDGTLLQGLTKGDFTMYDDGVVQEITFFTSDPFPLSAAVVLDVGMPEVALKKIRETLPALIGAFSQYDEISIFTYGNIVQKVQDFSGINATQLEASLRKVKNSSGKNGVPVLNGPFGGGANVNGIPVDPQTPQIQTYPRESYVLNDAILAAAHELGRRDPTRRKVLFVISDGREVGSVNNYSEVLKVLLAHQITVYAVDLNGGGIPGYRELEKIRIPGQGYGDILPKYASATGGQVYAEINSQAIEDSYSRITEEARNQYTIGYTTAGPPSVGFRTVEVRVDRPGLKVFARDGYYSLPPAK